MMLLVLLFLFLAGPFSGQHSCRIGKLGCACLNLVLNQNKNIN